MVSSIICRPSWPKNLSNEAVGCCRTYEAYEASIWVCLKIGYPNYSHLIGIMISKTIGFRGTQHFQTHPYLKNPVHLHRSASSRNGKIALMMSSSCLSAQAAKLHLRCIFLHQRGMGQHVVGVNHPIVGISNPDP